MRIFLGCANLNGLYRSKSFNITRSSFASLVEEFCISGIDTAESYSARSTLKGIAKEFPNIDLVTKISIHDVYKWTKFEKEIESITDWYGSKNGISILCHDSNLTDIERWRKYKKEIEKLIELGVIKKFGISSYLPYELDFFRSIYPRSEIIQVARNPFTYSLQNIALQENVSESPFLEKTKFMYRSIFAGGILTDLELLRRNLDKKFVEVFEKLMTIYSLELHEVAIEFQKCFDQQDDIVIGVDNYNQLKRNISRLQDSETRLSLENFQEFAKYDGLFRDLRNW